MEQKILKRLADTFHIAPSALRYWEKEGLIHFERSKENNYRHPTMQTMLEIYESLVNRSLSIPIKEMQKIPEMNALELEELLKKNERKLMLQAEEIQNTLKRIHTKQEMLNKYLNLKKQNKFVIEKLTFPAITEFSFQNDKDIQEFVQDPYQGAIWIVPNQEIQYGLVTNRKEAPILREADSEEKNYIKGLFRIRSDGTPDCNDEDFYNEAKRRGSLPSAIFGRFLISVCEEKRYDYYEAWMEI